MGSAYEMDSLSKLILSGIGDNCNAVDLHILSPQRGIKGPLVSSKRFDKMGEYVTAMYIET